jgi:hypothetical protein
MGFRITRVDEAHGTRLRIEGQLGGDGLSELRRVWEGARHPVTLELAGLRSADEPALSMLRQLRAAGATIVGASQYLELRLRSGAADR